jgi:Holliday junction resolvase RusA-like endonuclease
VQDYEVGDGWIEFEILGEPASKANSRRLVPGRTKQGKRYTKSIKSQKALDYVEAFKEQCPKLKPLWTCEVRLLAVVWYASRRPDLDLSLVEDALQGAIYENDRQIVEKIYIKRLDRERPRVHVRVEAVAGGDQAGGGRHRPSAKA